LRKPGRNTGTRAPVDSRGRAASTSFGRGEWRVVGERFDVPVIVGTGHVTVTATGATTNE
jgi:hypothetical protein